MLSGKSFLKLRQLMVCFDDVKKQTNIFQAMMGAHENDTILKMSHNLILR